MILVYYSTYILLYRLGVVLMCTVFLLFSDVWSPLCSSYLWARGTTRYTLALLFILHTAASVQHYAHARPYTYRHPFEIESSRLAYFFPHPVSTFFSTNVTPFLTVNNHKLYRSGETFHAHQHHSPSPPLSRTRKKKFSTSRHTSFHRQKNNVLHALHAPHCPFMHAQGTRSANSPSTGFI